MKVVCAVVANRIATLEQEDRLPLGLDTHATSCLRCQAVQARDRRMRRALSGLALHTVSAPAGLVAAVDSAIAPRLEAPEAEVDPRSEPVWKQIITPGAVAGVAAFAAGGAAVAAWRLTRRPA